jgi:hypothetical protein
LVVLLVLVRGLGLVAHAVGYEGGFCAVVVV